MKTPFPMAKKLIAITIASVLMAACSTTPERMQGADDARARLSQLQADSQRAALVPLAIEDAETAVRAAEVPRKDSELASHLVLMADRKVETAWSLANSRLLVDQRKQLAEQREAARLDARTREVDRARQAASVARSDADFARSQAYSARSDADRAQGQVVDARIDAQIAQSESATARADANAAQGRAINSQIDAQAAQGDAANARADADHSRSQADSARADTAIAQQQAAELQRQIVELNAKATNRGLVVTLGDVLFATGRAELKGGVPSNLNTLADFLNKYPKRTVLIEGHTDNVGSASSNLDLSQRRADSVKSYLVGQGIAGSRLAATGKGENAPVAGNDSSTGRQQNRRVEVIISNNALASQ